MKDDFDSSSHDSRKNYSGVYQQQGRVELDVDWNEKLENFIQLTAPCHTWQDIVLPNGILVQLKAITSKILEGEGKRKKWCFITGPIYRIKYRIGIIALFSGINSAGKTMAAEIIASELKLNMYRIDLAGVVNKYVGETEKNLNKVFDAAKQSGAILFIDEADTLFGKHSETRDSHDHSNNKTNYLIHRIAKHSGLAILATKHKPTLDDTLLNRVKFIIDFTSKGVNNSKIDNNVKKAKSK